MSRHVLTVTIGTSHIKQGDVSPPRVGSIIEILLDFVETDDPSPNEAMTVRAVLELNPTPRLDGHDSHPDGRYWLWFGELFGEGWRATWLGRRPKTGSVTVTGRFYPSRGLAYKRGSHGKVRGRVTRVQVQAIPYHCPGGTWRPLAGGPRSYRDVTLAPRWFDRSRLRDPEHDRMALVWADSGVIVDLDLDDVPPRALRPKIEPGDVAVGDHGIWVVDNQLPVVVLLSGDTATEYVFPGTTTSGRVLHATPDGCLIVEGGDIYRCVVNEPITKTANTVPGVSAGDTSMRFEQVDGVKWHVVLTSSTGRRTEVDAIQDGYVPAGSVVDGASFVAAVRDDTSADKTTSLVRITTAGRVTMGPPIPNDRRDYEKRITLVNNPLRIIQSHAFIPIRGDLSPGDPVVLHQISLRAGQAGDIAWIVSHPPSGRRGGQEPWWPLPEPVNYDTSRGQFWLLTLFDAHSRPTGSYPISTVSPGVAIDRNGDVWITDRGLRRLPAKPMTWSDPIDLDEAITRSIAPAIARGDGSS